MDLRIIYNRSENNIVKDKEEFIFVFFIPSPAPSHPAPHYQGGKRLVVIVKQVRATAWESWPLITLIMLNKESLAAVRSRALSLSHQLAFAELYFSVRNSVFLVSYNVPTVHLYLLFCQMTLNIRKLNSEHPLNTKFACILEHLHEPKHCFFW